MAVLPQVPGLSVHMQVAGQNLVEYPDPEPDTGASDTDVPDTPASYCYVESKAGERFTIQISVTPEFSLRTGCNYLEAGIRMDGSPIWAQGNMMRMSAVRSSPQTLSLSMVFTASDDPKTANLSHLVFVPVTTSEYSHLKIGICVFLP